MSTVTPDAPKAERSKAEYGLEEVEFLPTKTGGGRTSALAPLVEQVKERPGKWLSVARYPKSGAASAAASTLRFNYGPPEASGFSFATRQVTDTDGTNKTALFAKYEPEAIKPGAAENYAHAKAAKIAERLAKQEQKDKAKAKKQK